ncbi:gluconate 2-dehydrogenase subunit 3 family protein [Dyadobacter psychrotolerans]|uniref:Gluconate 2-dehydrogenase subunit 3 family protein n=1 Tax=Dyadobacter psychrotolerans TaxID=2541721 RepID=A0A4R5DXJ0_9BACT|nr:gluconate 2-dehydrogenase subunit 3 family protein [Dyadobacter psychrotolerans]TDE17180.1 gluconate 2-dehydrogenase subunit 3 family protein [Dyadobacter psychrotolerans]
MKRRDLLKNLLLTAGVLAADVTWSKSLQSAGSIKGIFPRADDQKLIAEIMETFIPETATPGAKSLKLDHFAMRMIRDCYVQNDQNLFSKGLALVDQVALGLHNKNFISGSKSERELVLKNMQESKEQMQLDFIKIIKALTIVGYQNSEYVMTNIQHYNMNPGFFNGCVPVSKS